MKRTKMDQMLEAWPYFGTAQRGPVALVEASDAMWRQGFELLNVWLDSVQRVWNASYQLAELPGMRRAPGGEPMRRAADQPWLPHMEAKVIPLRRQGDREGSSATRVSMRVPLLWPMDGADSVSLEATLGPETAARLGLDRIDSAGGTSRAVAAAGGKVSGRTGGHSA